MMEQRITARKNPLIQQVRKLLSSRKEREQSGLFVADGVKLLAEAVRWYPGLKTVILSDGIEADVPDHVRVVRVPGDVMESISPMAAPQGALFLCELPEKKPFVPKQGMLILDGIHVHPAAANLLLKAKGSDKVVLISDCMRAGGMADGEYMLGDTKTFVKDGIARTAEGNLAGSTLKLMDAVTEARRMRANQVTWQAVVEQLLLSLMEEKNQWST